MKTNPILSITFLAFAVLAAIIHPTMLLAASPERGFVSKAPASKWEEALVSGNGIHGAMVFGKPEDEAVVINHGQLYLPLHKPLPAPETATILPEIRGLMAGGQYQKAADRVVELANQNGYSGKHWTDPFIPACDLKIAMPPNGPIRDYERSVDFSNGVASVSWADDRGRFTRRLFVSRADDVIVMSIKGPAAAKVNCKLGLAKRPTTGTGGWGPAAMFKNGIKDVAIASQPGLLTYRSSFKNAYEGGLQGYEVVAKVIPKGGTMRADGGSLHVEGADEVMILLRVAPLQDFGKSRLGETAAALDGLAPDFEKLLAPHAAIHGGIFNRVKLDLGGGADRSLPVEDLIAKSRIGATNPALLEKLHDASRYNILSSSGARMPNLQGIWTGTWSPLWSGDFTMNGNLQTAMAANLSGNMAECLEPYWRFLDENMPAFRDNAKRLYGARGIHVPSRASSHGFNNHFDATWPMTFWTAGAAWAAQFLYDDYLYTGDKEFLRNRVLPFMKEAALFYEDFLIPGPDGKLLFSPSYSPENNPSNNPSQACVNATMDISAAKELLTNLIAACETLGVEKDGVTRWKELLTKMPAYQVNADGALKEWTTPDLADNYAHRHCSHLYAIYYGMPDEIANDAKLRAAFDVALEKRMDVRRKEAENVSLNGRPPGEMAFGIVFEAMAAASLGHADECALIVEWLANRYWNSNLVSTHNPKEIFNTDISGGLPTVIHRMLVDSQPGRIELLPALPATWYDGRIEGIRCRGNIEVRSLAWTHGDLAATLVSGIDQTIRISVPGESAPRTVELPAHREVTLTAKRPAAGLESLRNPVWTSADNLRDPSVLKTGDGYRLFYSRRSGNNPSLPESWHVAEALTKDFSLYENDRNLSPPGHASPGDVIEWHGRHILPYQTYPAKPTRLCFSESTDFKNWSPPKIMLEEAAALPWNDYKRVIDPTLVVDGDTLHCYFVGSGKAVGPGGKELRANLLGHAITRDPKLEKWEILTQDKPLIGVSEEAPDGVENIMVFRTGDHWTMIYSEGLENQHLARATSTDLVTWQPAGPIDIPVQSWMARKYGAPFVWREQDRWWMILMGENNAGRTTFGLLHSQDAVTWEPLPEGH